jgi:hypothetical protein
MIYKKINFQKIYYFFLLLFVLTIITKLYEYINYPSSQSLDELSYLYGSLELIQGESPHYSHSPGGLFYWILEIILIVKIFFFFILKIIFSKQILLNNFYLITENVIYDTYKNLFSLKLFAIIINAASSFVVLYYYYLFKKNFKSKILLHDLILIIIFSSSFYIQFLTQASPYFLSWQTLFASYLLIKIKKNKSSSVLLGISLGMRFEIIIALIYFLFFLLNRKEIKNYLIIVILSSILTSPWVLINYYSIFKTLIPYFLLNSQTSHLTSGNYIELIPIIYLFYLNFLSDKKKINYFLLVINIIFLIYFFNSDHAFKHLGFILFINLINILEKKIFNDYEKSIATIIIMINFIFFSFFFFSNPKFNEINVIKWIENNLPNNSIILKQQTIYELVPEKANMNLFWISNFFNNNELYYNEINKKYDYQINPKSMAFASENLRVTKGNYARYLFLANSYKNEKDKKFIVYLEGSNTLFFSTLNTIKRDNFYYLTKNKIKNNQNLIKQFGDNYFLYKIE